MGAFKILKIRLFFVSSALFISIASWPMGAPNPSSSPATSPSPPSTPRLSDEMMEKIRSEAKDIGPTKTVQGTWTGGGGNGVACFASESEARSGDVSNAQQLLTTDIWEFQQKFPDQGFFEPLPGEDSDAYLRRILETRIKEVSPLYAERVLDALQWVKQAPWNPRHGIREIHDVVLDVELPRRCRLVQLVARYFKSTPPHKPELFFDLDADLSARLGDMKNSGSHVINEAALKLHEALYMLAVEFGRTDSADARVVVGLLLSKKIDEFIQNSPKNLRPLAFRTFISTFGFDLVATLYGSNHPAPDHGPYSAETRRNSFMKLRKAMETSTRDWLRSKGWSFDEFNRFSQNAPSKYLQGLYEVGKYFAETQVPLLNEEAVFLYVSMTMLDSEDFESLLIEADGRSTVRSFCGKIRMTQFNLAVSSFFGSIQAEEPRDQMLNKALSYCDGEQLALDP